MQQVIKSYLKKFKTFLNYSKNFLRRKNPFRNFKKNFVANLKDALAFGKKRKMLKYKLKYQMHQLNQIERLIAENSQHAFLRGNKFNEMR